MNSTQKVVKNSIWLMVQPLLLNIISLFVIGYIARTLGQSDYGKFVFAFAFVTMFGPITSMGLRAITVREIAEDKSKTSVFLGKIIVLRLFLSLIAVAAVFVIVNLMNYSQTTKIIVYLASLTIVFNAVTSTINDTFQAYEKMKYIAYIQFVGGFVLTALSVIVLYAGYRLIGLTLVYVVGSFLSLMMAVFYLLKVVAIPKIKIDVSFWKKNLYKGIPFFSPSLVALASAKIGIIFLSKMSGDISVGIYGAANNLIEKLIIIPDAIGTAIFPTMAALYKNQKDDAAHLFQKFFLYLFLIGLPISIGITVLAKPIINLIYGANYQTATLILQILSWWLLLIFFNAIQKGTLEAIHQEKKIAVIPFITVPCFLILNLILIPKFKGVGLGISCVVNELIFFVISWFLVKKHVVKNVIKNQAIIRVFIANILMAVFVYLLRKYNIALSIVVGMVSYCVFVLAFKIVSFSELNTLLQLIIRKKLYVNKKAT